MKRKAQKSPKKNSYSIKKRSLLIKIIDVMRGEEGLGDIKSLAQKLGVSQQTIRRSFDFLEENPDKLDIFTNHERLVKLPPSSARLISAGHQTITSQTSNEKVATFIEKVIIKNKATIENKLIILDSGDLCEQVAKQFPRDINVKVLTNSPQIAVILKELPQVKVKIIGGWLFNNSLIPSGNEIFSELQNTYAEICILCDCKLEIGKGITVYDDEIAKLKRAMVNCSKTIAFMATPFNIGKYETNIVMSIEKLNYFYLDRSLSKKESDFFKNLPMEIIAM